MMTKEQILAALKESNALNVNKAEDTIQNIDKKVVNDSKAAEGMGADPLPTQKEVEKVVNAAEGPMIPVDKDGMSKDGGDDNRMEDGKVEAEKKREDNSMKDVINVSSRKVEEATEVNNELLDQLKEAAEREEKYKNKINEITALCEKALKNQYEALTKEHAAGMKTVFESVIAEGEKLEKELSEAAAKNEKMYKTAKKLHENSAKLSKILLEAVKKAQPEKQMTRYMTAKARAVASLRK